MCFAASDMVGFFLAGLVLKYFKVGRGLRLSYTIAATGGLFYVMFGHTSETLLPILICMARVGCTMGFNIGYISVPRLFPTRFVATVYGITNLIAHTFACLAPMVAEIKDPYPFTIFLLCIIASFMCSYSLVELD